MERDRLEAILFRTEVFASSDGLRLGLRTQWPEGDIISAEADVPAAVLEAFRVELETSGRQRLGGNWVAVPVAEPVPEGTPARLDRAFVLLPIDLLTAGLDVLEEIDHSVAVDPARENAADNLDEEA